MFCNDYTITKSFKKIEILANYPENSVAGQCRPELFLFCGQNISAKAENHAAQFIPARCP